MKIEKKPSWRNNKCNECGDLIFINKAEETSVYFCTPKNTSNFRTWKLCEKCAIDIFGEEKVKNG